MPLTEKQHQQLQDFFNKSDFPEKGGVITDLDGTAIHEFKGSYSIPRSVEVGLQKIYDLGRPIVINTLRFPLSVMRTFGKDWYKISGAPIPTVLMNGSQLGYIKEMQPGELVYEEIDAFPLREAEVADVLKIINQFVADGVTDLLVFYYPRDWTKGEIIWTPLESKIGEVENKYLSASSVFTGPVTALQEALMAEDICMVFLLIEIPEDQLMAYQHSKKSNFFTHQGVDKLFGARQMAKHLGFRMDHSLGAGDTLMDTFLKGVGLAVHVNNPYLKFEGVLPPLDVAGSSELGEILFELAAMQKTVIH